MPDPMSLGRGAAAMILCHCEVVSDRAVRQAIATGATSLCAISQQSGAGRGCGGCLSAIREHLRAHGLPTDELLTARQLRGLVDPGAPSEDAVAV